MNTALPLLALLWGAPPAPPPPASPAPELPLADALSELDRRSPTLTQARGRAEEASALSRQVLAGLVPTLTASASLFRNSDEVIIDLAKLVGPRPGLPAPMVQQPLHSLTGTLAARVPLLVPSTWFELSAAHAGERGAAAQAEASRLALRASLVSTAHVAVAGEEIVAATERAVANAAALAESADRRVAAGTAPSLDALRARTEQVKRTSDLVRARADLERARLALGVLIGRDGPVRIALPPQPAEAALDEPSLVAEARERRPELAAAAAQADAADAQVTAAWARLAPQLSASGSAFEADVRYPTGQYTGWRVSLDLTWPLYDGGARYGKRREAEARVVQARAAAEAQRLAVGEEARDAARDLGVAAERLRLAEEQRRLADDAHATARRGYDAGVASSLDVLDASDRLYAADIGLADARARLGAARVALERALGRGP